MESASCLAGLIARKPTLTKLSLGDMAFDSMKMMELDVPIAAAAVLTWGGDIAADRKAHTGTFRFNVRRGKRAPLGSENRRLKV